jgi:hypothetical protein
MLKASYTYKSAPSSVDRIHEIHERNELNESGEKPIIFKKEEEVKKVKHRN